MEAAPGCADEPRAVTLVDESLRILQAIGVLADIEGDLVWNSGAAYFGSNGKPLVVVRPAIQTLGFPQKNFFDQPGLQRALLRAAQSREGIRLHFDCGLSDLSQDSHQVIATTTSSVGTERRFTARYVVGCDGGRSAVRACSGIEMTGSSQTEPWIVVDLVNDSHQERMALFYCTPTRPTVVVPGTNGRCRYEFMLLPGESHDEVLEYPFLAELLRPYRSLDLADIRRKAVYVAHQLVADRWRSGRVLLAGDAAHLMPPFAGQGLNTGLRDARNLAWKVAAVVGGQASEALLDSYQDERQGHARAMVNLSHRMGKLIMTADPRRARIRDLVFRASGIVPPVRKYFATMRFVKQPRVEGGLVVRLEGSGPLVGGYLPQPVAVATSGRRAPLDELLGQGWAILQVGPQPAIPTPSLAALDGLSARFLAVVSADRIPRDRPDVQEICDTEDLLPQPPHTRYLLVRPDRVVAADFTSEQVLPVADGLRGIAFVDGEAPPRRTGSVAAVAVVVEAVAAVVETEGTYL